MSVTARVNNLLMNSSLIPNMSIFFVSIFRILSFKADEEALGTDDDIWEAGHSELIAVYFVAKPTFESELVHYLSTELAFSLGSHDYLSTQR